MLVVVQFPIADARRFLDVPGGYLPRPSWRAPRLGVAGDFVWGFGRVVERKEEADPAWTDEACFALATSALRLPSLVKRRIQPADGTSAFDVACRFRRLFHDGTCVARVEVGFSVEPAPTSTVPMSAGAAVGSVLRLPAMVPRAGTGQSGGLFGQGPRLAARFRTASTPRPSGDRGLVASGAPTVIVDLIGKDSVALPPSLVDASAVTQGRVAVGFELARVRDSQIPTWYLGPAANADTDLHRNLRICLLRMHAEQEVLDRIITWVDDGELDFHPGSDAAQRLELYVDRATQLLDSTYKYGLKASAVRDAYAVGAAVSRADIVARRRQGLDGMRLQIRRKAEAFAAERDALRPQINIVGGDLVEGMKVDKSIHAGDINAPIAIDSTQTISNSFNAFAANRGDQDELLQQMTTLRDSITALVQALAKQDPDAAKEVAETFQSFTEESGKQEPKKGTLRALGTSLIQTAQKVAEVAAPVASAVLGVLKVLGIVIAVL